MANLSLTTRATTLGRLDPVQKPADPDSKTLPAAEAITAGAPVRIDADGNFTNANGTTSTEADVWGVALRTVAAREAVTAYRSGVLDGVDVSGLAFNARVYASDTDGRIGDAAGTVSRVIGRVVPGTATTLGTAYDKLLSIEL